MCIRDSLNLEVLSVPEALVYSIRILVAPGVFLARRWRRCLAAASIKVMDALFGLVARNDVECCKRELLGRSWRRDWGMRDFRSFSKIEDLRKFGSASKKMEDRMLGGSRRQ